VGALATKWHCQLDAGATQRVVVKISTETRPFRPKNKAAKPKNVLMTGHEPNVE